MSASRNRNVKARRAARRNTVTARTLTAARPIHASAREWFAYLRPILHASRPVIGTRAVYNPGVKNADGSVPMATSPIYGKPTFRNVIDENGRHV